VAASNEIVDLLISIGRTLRADFVQVQPDFGPIDRSLGWVSGEAAVDADRQAEIVRRGQDSLASREGETPGPQLVTFSVGDFQAIAIAMYGGALQDAALVVARDSARPYEPQELEMIEAFARLIPVAMERAGAGSPLDDLVTHIATRLMSVNVSSLQAELERVIRTLAEFFQVSTTFMRRNDHQLRASVLIAEWPPRDNIPNPDPLAVVPFEGPDTDPVFAAIANLRDTLIIGPDQEDDYQRRVRQASGAPPVALAMVPILRDEITSGVLGFINFGVRVWSKAELNALRAIASLLSQLEARVEAEYRLQQHAYHDELTGLLNRRALKEALDHRLNRPSAREVAVVFADLDRLKALNDSLGHATGDAVLREIAGRLSEQMRPNDLIGRLGGDEFVFVFGGSLSDPLKRATRIVAEVSAMPLELQPSTVSTPTMCAGVAVGRPGELTSDELLHRADVALIEAKAAGPGHVILFDDEMLARSKTRDAINRHLTGAASDGALQLYYLPEVDLRSGRLLAIEALVRWHHPELGLLLPGSFIPLAEESPSTIKEIGDWVLNEACRQLAAWRIEFPEQRLKIRVNVSPVQLMLGDMARGVSKVLRAHRLQGRDLCLELTERAVFREMDQILAELKKVRALGVSVALDDFGTGYSTFTQLRSLPVDTLKIDKQFISELHSRTADQAIVESTLLLAKNFGLDVVAEGVESVLSARELVRMGCYRAQGHLVQFAAPAEEVHGLISRGAIDIAGLGLGVV
jgi:diguanylate cyclase (GGDEF)-like protein